MNDPLDTSIQYIKGVGPKRAQIFKKMGIHCVYDLITYYPRAYKDRSIVKSINKLEEDDEVSIQAKIISLDHRKINKRKLSITKVTLQDQTGYVTAVWFNQDYIINKIQENQTYWFFGKFNKKGIFYEVNSPDVSDDFDTFTKIVPVYSKTTNITQYTIRNSVKNALNGYLSHIDELFHSNILRDNHLLPIKTALMHIHFPSDNRSFFEARKRLVFEELFLLQLGLFFIKKKFNENKESYAYKKFTLKEKYIKQLPFPLTNAQNNVLQEIEEDLKSNTPMHRLLQGDVGSGKTVVAICLLISAYENGLQGAFMVPTEILAKQHYEHLKKDLQDMDIQLEYLGGKMTASQKKKALANIKSGKCDIVIGTHALIQESVQFKNLGLVVTDEQHRFGVDQRSTLIKKGKNPHVLVMTATPIPRTLAMILYGDLDISIIDEMPPGRKKIETYVVDETKRNRVYSFIEKRIHKKNQVYVVCPLIEENEENDLNSVEKTYGLFVNRFSEFRVALLHGKMKSIEKEAIMQEFHKGNIHILVSTTVIEVGVNVTNATLMIVENAERFGLAQLHQLRGRVGRGKDQSYCILFNQSKSDLAKKRMMAMEKSNDGFYLSEQDLILRGPGDFFGTKQHGLPDLKIANLYHDVQLLKEAQKAAEKIIEEDPLLNDEKNDKIYDKIIKTFKNKTL